MKEYIFLYRGGNPDWATQTPPEEMQATMAKWGSWMSALGESGHLVNGGAPLEYEGKRMTKDGVVTDISAAELKELVSGYSIIKAENYDEALKIARECPIFLHEGTTLEVRPVATM